MSTSTSNMLVSSADSSATSAGRALQDRLPRHDVGHDRFAVRDGIGESGSEGRPSPPTGSSAWDCLGAATTEAGFLANANLMAERLLPFGYDIAMVGPRWYAAQASASGYRPFAPLELDAHGRPQPAADRFPSAMEGLGFAPLASRVHRLGLRFGVHLMRGIPCQAVGRGLPIAGSQWGCDEIASPDSTCAWNADMCGIKLDHPGAFDWYRAWLTQLAACGVDAVTVDDLASSNGQAGEVALIRRAIDAIGRPIELTLSSSAASRYQGRPSQPRA